MDKPQPAYVVRAAGGKLVEHFLKGSFVGIGFGLDDVRDLNADELREHIAQTSGGSSYRVGARWASVRTFMLDMHLGDWLAVPDLAQDRYLLGQVTGEVEYKADWGDDCSFKLRRPVQWMAQVPRTELDDDTRRQLGRPPAVFRVTEVLPALKDHRRPLPGKIVVGSALNTALLKKLRSLDPRAFEEFVGDLLEAIGYTGEVTRYVGDGGVDYQGLWDSGIFQVPVKVQVKRKKGRVGSPVIRQLRGALVQDEFGMVITTGHFSSSATKEATRSGTKTIELIDGQQLVEMVLEHFESLRSEHRKLLGLRRMIVME